MSPRMAWRASQESLPADVIISGDIGNNCAIGNADPSFEAGRKYLSPGFSVPCGYGFPSISGAKIGKPNSPVVGFAGDGAFGISMSELTACDRNVWLPITIIVFRNHQWGAEKRNTTFWYDDNFVGTELNKGVKVATPAELERALADAIEGQMQHLRRLAAHGLQRRPRGGRDERRHVPGR